MEFVWRLMGLDVGAYDGQGGVIENTHQEFDETGPGIDPAVSEPKLVCCFVLENGSFQGLALLQQKAIGLNLVFGPLLRITNHLPKEQHEKRALRTWQGHTR